MTESNDKIQSVEITTTNPNLAKAEAAKQVGLPHPWAQYWMDRRYNDAFDTERIDSYKWRVNIDVDKVQELQTA